MDEQDGEVVTLRGIAHEVGHVLLDVLQVVLGALPPVKGFLHAFLTELLVGGVLGLGEPVGIEQEASSWKKGVSCSL